MSLRVENFFKDSKGSAGVASPFGGDFPPSFFEYVHASIVVFENVRTPG